MTVQQKDSVDQISNQNDWSYVAIGAVVIVSLLAALVFIGSKKTAAELGPIGDWFGGLLNPSIAFLALLGLAKSISVQNKTLQITKNGLNQQLGLQRNQAARTSFFNLLTLRAEAVNSVQWYTNSMPSYGGIALSNILDSLTNLAENISPNDEDIESDLRRWEVPSSCPTSSKPYIALFAALYSNEPMSMTTAWHEATLTGDELQLLKLEAKLGHVFRATYQVLKFVHECNDLNNSEKIDFANYLRAQMSESEFALFALTALTSIGEKSRAISIAFDFYEDRLYSIPWARDLTTLFDASIFSNREFAQKTGYQVLK
jgi:Putative phage abortive infection protein